MHWIFRNLKNRLVLFHVNVTAVFSQVSSKVDGVALDYDDIGTEDFFSFFFFFFFCFFFFFFVFFFFFFFSGS
jgi:hypothetical protein